MCELCDCSSFAVSGIRFFFFNDTATTEIYTLSLHDALPICQAPQAARRRDRQERRREHGQLRRLPERQREPPGAARKDRDRKSTRLNSSHANISYAVFCLKKKNQRPVSVAYSFDCAHVALIC